ncbi:helix-turn-helix domain-containing protein [Staphylococcus saprophyticus]|uniref:helix-turn-helix domain-containing protein n=1 Tax=Staphylococcus saprophyticus TaxID=29385 RepID=UPI000E076FE2|nr:XRE family transcriptional regulator [Staphylococcus saprophyticus]MDW4225102.1 XRE family transcriptional regulator [Staphylococcus saprophyticus]MDW4230192.1 XRE family transcriptional regulator [Staphylococcus saprophyticus]MDW4244717.1 XRE family transcriptional regulator [Staphylococcus saprophyticus]MDW4257042.1 XRE family transcriptional regulator [Staphylococcus saprophyticus]MDW4259687.1 XRE family transcriptional regulator [Staphylococcus saprophyticus]
MSLEKLSKLMGVSTSSLNEIEKGNTIPSINTVWKISNGLKLSFSSLMSEAESDYVQVNKEDVVPVTEDEGKYRVYPYFPFEKSKSFEFFYVELDPGATLDSEPHLSGSEESIIIVDGQLEMHLENEVIDLGKGDALRFKSDIAHSYTNHGEDMTLISMVIDYK